MGQSTPPIPEVDDPGGDEGLASLRVQFAKISGRVSPVTTLWQVVYGAVVFFLIFLAANALVTYGLKP